MCSTRGKSHFPNRNSIQEQAHPASGTSMVSPVVGFVKIPVLSIAHGLAPPRWWKPPTPIQKIAEQKSLLIVEVGSRNRVWSHAAGYVDGVLGTIELRVQSEQRELGVSKPATAMSYSSSACRREGMSAIVLTSATHRSRTRVSPVAGFRPTRCCSAQFACSVYVLIWNPNQGTLLQVNQGRKKVCDLAGCSFVVGPPRDQQVRVVQ